MGSYTVLVDDNFHYQDEDERFRHGRFESYEEAVSACRRIVDELLLRTYEPGMTAQELHQRYTAFGEAPSISPDGPRPHFSAGDYATQRCHELCVD